MRRNSKLHSCYICFRIILIERKRDNGTCVIFVFLCNYFKGLSPVYLLDYSMQTLHYKKFFCFLKVCSLSIFLSCENMEQNFDVLKSSSSRSQENQLRVDMDPLIYKKKLGYIA